jgi:pimeloyl-ACP methyl ester carboxylesterase
MRTDTLDVPGATLYYHLRGTGPLLMFLPGGDGDADVASALCDRLADRFTVVTYDRRGLSRSTIEPAAVPPTVVTHADDAYRLLAALTAEPAILVGSSIGAVIALEIATRHPDRVSTVVAHEPPVFQVLGDAERAAAQEQMEAIENLYHREGAAPAMAKFAGSAGVDLQDREPDVKLTPPTTRERVANLTFLFTYDAPAVRRHRLDLAALRRATMRLVCAAGRAFPNSVPHRCASALADELGTALVDFPGGHTAWLLRPAEFASRLREILDA